MIQTIYTVSFPLFAFAMGFPVSFPLLIFVLLKGSSRNKSEDNQTYRKRRTRTHTCVQQSYAIGIN